MKAIVLSCDKYHPLTEHMLLTYKTIWPSNKFSFRIPWNEKYPQKIKDQFFNNTHLIQTDMEFKKTVDSLLKDLGDEEWIYWCIDDKYLIDLDENKANTVVDFVESIEDPNITGVCFHFVREIRTTARSPRFAASQKNIKFNDLTFIRHHSYTNGWLHQFRRVGSLREFMGNIREPKRHQARSMDFQVKPLEGILLTLDHNIATYGESTDKGALTHNCMQSFKKYGLKLPANFRINHRFNCIIK